MKNLFLIICLFGSLNVAVARPITSIDISAETKTCYDTAPTDQEKLRCVSNGAGYHYFIIKIMMNYVNISTYRQTKAFLNMIKNYVIFNDLNKAKEYYEMLRVQSMNLARVIPDSLVIQRSIIIPSETLVQVKKSNLGCVENAQSTADRRNCLIKQENEIASKIKELKNSNPDLAKEVNAMLETFKRNKEIRIAEIKEEFSDMGTLGYELMEVEKETLMKEQLKMVKKMVLKLSEKNS